MTIEKHEDKLSERMQELNKEAVKDLKTAAATAKCIGRECNKEMRLSVKDKRERCNHKSQES